MSLNLALIIGASILLGICMKLADLFDEHGLKWFKGDAILFGILWGAFAGILVLVNPVLAGVWMAIVIGYLFRGRIDYLNHGIAVGLVLLFYVFGRQTLDLPIFAVSFALMMVSGALEDWKEVRIYKTASLHDVVYYLLWPLAMLAFFRVGSSALSLPLFILSYEIVKFRFEAGPKSAAITPEKI